MTKITASTITQLFRPYGTVPIGVKKARFGIVNSIFFVRTKKGLFVLKIFKEKTPIKALQDQLRVLSLLREKRLPVEAIVATKNGKKLSRWKNRFYWVCKFIDGRHLKQKQLTKKNVRSAVLELAKVHKALMGFRQNARKEKYFDLFSFRFDEKVRQEHYSNFFSRNEKYSNWDKRIMETMVDSRCILKKMSKKGFKRGILHNDYSLENLLFKGTKVSGILDFGFLGPGFLVSDLASALTYASVSTNKVDVSIFKTGLSAYLKKIKLNKKEILALKPLMVHQMVIVLNYYIRQLCIERTKKLFRDFENYYKMLCQLQDETEIEQYLRDSFAN